MGQTTHEAIMANDKQNLAEIAVYNFKEDKRVLEQAKRQAHAEGTQLATILRRFLRQYTGVSTEGQ